MDFFANACVPAEPPSHEELDRRRRQYEEELLAFQWTQLRHERDTFYASTITPMSAASSLLHLASSTSSESSLPDSICDDEYSDGDDLLNKSVLVYWDGDKRAYSGKVTAVKSMYFVSYDDGDSGWEERETFVVNEFKDTTEKQSSILTLNGVIPCRRTSGCPKMAGHRGACPGTRRCKLISTVMDNLLPAKLAESTVLGKRCRKATCILGDGDGWGARNVASRKWSSNRDS